MFISEKCTLHEIVRDLIERSHIEGSGLDPTWPRVWLPDLSLDVRNSRLAFAHDCRKLPASVRRGKPAPELSKPDGTIVMQGRLMPFAENACMPVYCATCRTCECHFFSLAVDPDDTFDNFIAKLKENQ